MPKLKDENQMAKNAIIAANEPDDEKDDGESPESGKSPKTLIGTDSGKKVSSSGFFTIYKFGQGKWTRLGTLAVAGVLGSMTSYTLYQWLVSYWASNPDPIVQRKLQRISLGIAVAFMTVFSVLVYRVTNKPGNVDFLIATDSEMKKVNWTSKGELLGSTRVVVIFLFFIAIFLFLVDLLFSNFFQMIGVLLKSNY